MSPADCDLRAYAGNPRQVGWKPGHSREGGALQDAIQAGWVTGADLEID